MPLAYRSTPQTALLGLGNAFPAGPSLGLGNGFPPDLSISDAYRWLQDQCETQFGSDVCGKFLPAQPIWLPPHQTTQLPWYVWAIIGLVAGKVIL